MNARFLALFIAFAIGGPLGVAHGAQDGQLAYDAIRTLEQRAATVGQVSWRDGDELVTAASTPAAIRERAILIMARDGDSAARASVLAFLKRSLDDSSDKVDLDVLVRSALVALVTIESDERHIDRELAGAIADLVSVIFPKHSGEMLEIQPYDELVLRLGADKTAQSRAAIALYRGSMSGGFLRSSAFLPPQFFQELQGELATSIERVDPENRVDMKAASALAVHGYRQSLPVFQQALAAVERDLVAAQRGVKAPGILGSVKALENVRYRLTELMHLMRAHESIESLLTYASGSADGLGLYGFEALRAAERLGATRADLRPVLDQVRSRVVEEHDAGSAEIILTGVKTSAMAEGWLTSSDWPDVIALSRPQHCCDIGWVWRSRP